MMMRLIGKMLRPIKNRISLMVSRAVLVLIDDGTTLQQLQARILGEELLDDLERFQQYGFTSVPHSGAEAIALSVGGQRSHTVVINVDDRRYRLRGLKGGEVALYDDRGQYIHLTRSGADINILGALTGKVTGEASLDCPQTNLTGNLFVGGNLVVAGIGSGAGGPFQLSGGLVNSGGDIVSDGIVLDTHRHTGVNAGSNNSGGPV